MSINLPLEIHEWPSLPFSWDNFLGQIWELLHLSKIRIEMYLKWFKYSFFVRPEPSFAFYFVCSSIRKMLFVIFVILNRKRTFVLFCDFRFNIAEPIYVNMVRDPVERVISWYYYVRAPWYFVERKRAFPDLPLPNPNWLRKVRLHFIKKLKLMFWLFLFCLLWSSH